jgi:type IV pilus assembly protein PilN
MQVHLNLATKPLETHRRFLAGAGLTAFIAAVVFVALGWHVYSVRKADEELRTRTEKTRKEMTQLESKRKDLEVYFGQKEIASLHDRAAFLNGIIDARSFNWTQMFMDLERILPGGVRVISIEPKQAGGHVEVKLTVGATSDDAKLKFLHALEESKQFKGYELQHEGPPNQANNQSGDQKIIQLTTIYSRT